MVTTGVLMAIAMLVPLVSVFVVRLGSLEISERHHSHHDTYMIAGTFSWGVLFSMLFMGAFGLISGWLCLLTTFEADPKVVLAFSDTFLLTTFAAWMALRRYRVVTFDDYMCVTPFIGSVATIRYDEISAMEWNPSFLVPHARNVSVFVGHRRRALLWAVLDLDQILMRINRFDVLENLTS